MNFIPYHLHKIVIVISFLAFDIHHRCALAHRAKCMELWIWMCAVSLCLCIPSRCAIFRHNAAMNRRDVRGYLAQFTQQGNRARCRSNGSQLKDFWMEGSGTERERWRPDGNTTQDNKWKQIHLFLLHQEEKIIINFWDIGSHAELRAVCIASKL